MPVDPLECAHDDQRRQVRDALAKLADGLPRQVEHLSDLVAEFAQTGRDLEGLSKVAPGKRTRRAARDAAAASRSAARRIRTFIGHVERVVELGGEE